MKRGESGRRKSAAASCCCQRQREAPAASAGRTESPSSACPSDTGIESGADTDADAGGSWKLCVVALSATLKLRGCCSWMGVAPPSSSTDSPTVNVPQPLTLPERHEPHSAAGVWVKRRLRGLKFGCCRVTLSRSVPYFSRLKSRISRIVAQKRESNSPYQFDGHAAHPACCCPMRLDKDLPDVRVPPVPGGLGGVADSQRQLLALHFLFLSLSGVEAVSLMLALSVSPRRGTALIS
eukprot:SAG31_NODE_3989_length_3681_cov_6.728042_4_plen_237_part_00